MRRRGRAWWGLGLVLAVLGAMMSGGGSRAAASVVVPRPTGSWIVPEVVPGDFNHDGGTDVALIGSLTPATAWPSFPVALSHPDGTFAVSDAPSSTFARLASAAGAERITGDFNGDGRTDIAATCGCGWSSVPMAFSTGNGGFTETNKPVAGFAAWAGMSGARTVTGDFNHDGKTDLALVGGQGWTTIPVALSKGDGTFTVTNSPSPDFAAWAQQVAVSVLTGDFNHDGRTDLALTPGTSTSTWQSVPVAFSKGDGTFTVTNSPVPDFTGWAKIAAAVPVTGDFDHDGRTDIALPGGATFTTIPIAFSNGDGTFHVTNAGVGQFATWAQTSRVAIVPGDYNHDGLTDFALTAPTGWTSIPVAFSTGDGGFTVTNTTLPDFPGLAQATGAHVVPGDFNHDGRADISLVGGVGWTTQPIAFSTGNGGFTVTNAPAPLFARWAQADATYITTAVPAPSLDVVQAAGTSVTVRWTDRSTNEDAFVVLSRDPVTGLLRFRTDVPSIARAGTGQSYTFTDAVPAGSRQCYEIAVYNYQASSGVNFSNDQCTAPVTLPPPPPIADGTLSIPDTNGVTGVESSVAVGRDGLGIISYFVGGTNCVCNLRVAHCSDTDCTTVTTHDIDTAGNVGSHSSIKIGTDGLPLISYTSYADAAYQSTKDLKVAHCIDVQCSSATVTTLDAAATVDAPTSLTIGADGLGLIAYQDNPSSRNETNIKVAHCLDVACTSARLVTVDTVGRAQDGNDSPGIVAITAAPTGVAYLAYRDSTHQTLKLDVCGEPNCTLQQAFSLDAAAAGFSPSITMGRDGLPLLSYMGNYTNAGSDLVVAHCINVRCTAVTRTLVHTAVFTGWYGSIAVGADGLGVVAFTDATNKNVEVAHCADVTCSSLEHHVIDEFDNQGWNGDSIAIGADGLPLITYLDLTDDVLKVAHCADVACALPLGTPFFTGHGSKKGS